MPKSGKKKMTSVLKDYRATKCDLHVSTRHEVGKHIRLDTTGRMFS